MERQQEIGGKLVTPPYADYHSFSVFLEEAKKKLPQCIDRKYLRQTSIAISAYRTLLTSLRSLGLINDEGKPTLLLSSLLKEGDELVASLQELVKSIYGDLLEKEDLATLSAKKAKEISPYFEDTYNLSASTAFACASFFKRLAKDAKLLSNKHKGKLRTATQVETKDKINLLAIKSQLLQRLPNFDGWRADQIQIVLQQFERLLAHLDK